MNEIIISILKIYITASIVYFIYLIYLKITKSKTVDDLINEYNEETMINEYKKMKKENNSNNIRYIIRNSYINFN